MWSPRLLHGSFFTLYDPGWKAKKKRMSFVPMRGLWWGGGIASRSKIRYRPLGSWKFFVFDYFTLFFGYFAEHYFTNLAISIHLHQYHQLIYHAVFSLNFSCLFGISLTSRQPCNILIFHHLIKSKFFVILTMQCFGFFYSAIFPLICVMNSLSIRKNSTSLNLNLLWLHQ